MTPIKRSFGRESYLTTTTPPGFRAERGRLVPHKNVVKLKHPKRFADFPRLNSSSRMGRKDEKPDIEWVFLRTT